MFSLFDECLDRRLEKTVSTTILPCWILHLQLLRTQGDGAILMIKNQTWIEFNCISEPYSELVHLCHCYFCNDPNTFTIYSSGLSKRLLLLVNFCLTFAPYLIREKNILYLLTNQSVPLTWTNNCLSSLRSKCHTVMKAITFTLVSSDLILVH